MIGERLAKIVLGKVVSEKSTKKVENDCYTFKVLPDANKLEIGLAIEKMFGVRVKNVRVLNLQGKRKKIGSKIGKRKNWRKAYVRIQEGDEINFGND